MKGPERFTAQRLDGTARFQGTRIEVVLASAHDEALAARETYWAYQTECNGRHFEYLEGLAREERERAEAAERERDEAKAALAEWTAAWGSLDVAAAVSGLRAELAEARADINCPDCLHMNPDTACTRTEGRE